MRFPLNPPAFFATAALFLFLSSTGPAGGQEQQDQLDPAPTSPAAVRSPPTLSSPTTQVLIPGPLRSFLRMAGISQDLPVEDVLPEVARNAYSLGYQHGHDTEFLILLHRYVRQARALQAIAGANGEIRIMHCAEAGPLLQILGYRLRNGCGEKDASLVALNPESAFLTIDSGFPLTQLEEALSNDTPFVYPYVPSRVPVMLNRKDWTGLSSWRRPVNEDVLDAVLHDPRVARLYWAFSKIDPETRVALQRSVGLGNLLPYAGVLDFYGSQICIRSRKVLVPGGKGAESSWSDLVGASPASPGEFVTRLMALDRGWIAVYFDTLARIGQKQQAHFVQGSRLRHFYEEFRGDSTPNVHAAAASFRKGSGLMILLTRQQWQPNGEPVIPGGVDVWKEIVGKHARRWNHPEQVLEEMISYARFDSARGPLQIYISLSAMESARRPQSSLSPETLLLIAHKYEQYSSWYPIFSEFPELSGTSITRFIDTAESLDRISNQELRGNALGIFQANLGLWQIMARQGEIPKDKLDASWQKIIDPFAKINSSPQLFDAGVQSTGELMFAATGRSSYSQDEIIALLAGPRQESVEGRRARAQLARRIRSVIDDQRLTSLDTLEELGDGLKAAAHGGHPSERLRSLAGELREFEMPRPIFTQSEKGEWAPGVFSQHHTEGQIHTDLTKVLEQPGSPAKLDAARGELASFLRDTLVGLNYAYYEPPGSQILHINPLFVRSHDFAAETVVGIDHVWQAPTLFGQGASAGGGAYLVGSLADLPYILAATEQNFIAPENVQALIWEELVPSLLANATLSRWWNISPRELHAVALYQESGEELLAASVNNQQLKNKVLAILSDRMSPQRLEEVEEARQPKDMEEAITRLTPSDTFFLAAEFRQRFPQDSGSWGPESRELDKLCRDYPTETGLEHISKDFGSPHPTLAQTYGRDLMSMKPLPPFAGYSSRLLGESWDSSNLYWARLADEQKESPEMLNVISPQLTRSMISKIFATDSEDWPSVARAMHKAGDEFLRSKAVPPPTAETAARH
jgi:hypothetical protein